MTNINLILVVRTLFQVFAFGIFVFQIQNSVKEYLEKPVYQTQSSTNFNTGGKPIFYVCQEDQFDYEMARRFGYFWRTDYTIGKLMETNHVSWTGKEVNKSYEEYRDLIYNADYTNFTVLNSDLLGLSDLHPVLTEDLFVSTYGLCKEIKETKVQTIIRTTKKSVFCWLTLLQKVPLGFER